MPELDDVLLSYEAPPATWRFMLGALVPSPGLARGARRIAARWQGHRPDASALDVLARATGLATRPALPIIYPYAVGFRLHMAVLTHPRYPLPIWGALQVRNRIIQHRPIPSDSALDIETLTADRRILEKGVEIDIRTVVRIRGELVWESTNTAYYRGRYGVPDGSSGSGDTPDLPSETVAEWEMPSTANPAFARLTGDHNGIHRWDWYARRFGFRRAFFHPQLVVGQCLTRLQGPPPRGAEHLDLWLKGPVYVGSRVTLRAATRPAGITTLALHADGDARPAIVGRWRVAQ